MLSSNGGMKLNFYHRPRLRDIFLFVNYSFPGGFSILLGGPSEFQFSLVVRLTDQILCSFSLRFGFLHVGEVTLGWRSLSFGGIRCLRARFWRKFFVVVAMTGPSDSFSDLAFDRYFRGFLRFTVSPSKPIVHRSVFHSAE